MDGHLEPLSSVLRIGGAYGEPYEWVATIRYISPTEVEVLGALVAPTFSQRRAIRNVLLQHGIEKAFYYRRRKDGSIKKVELMK